MKTINECKFWLVIGSQFLYGPEVLDTVEVRAKEMAAELSADKNIPCTIEYKVTVKTEAEAYEVMKAANADDSCAGVITWCHTFSPSKMWIGGFGILNKPLCHLATQYNMDIPNEEIDMDFMNLNQAAHGDREHGFITSRMHLNEKIIAGYWKDETVRTRLGKWMRTAFGAEYSKRLKVMRFGDNMREVAVTEGDKVEAQIKFGWQVNTWPVGKLAQNIDAVSDEAADALVEEYKNLYDFNTDDLETIRYQAKEEIAMKEMLDAEGCKAMVNNFQDLVGMKQLPGIATQHLMHMGYGYGAEGDWKTSAMVAIVKAMTEGQDGGTAFMEDYTYNLDPDNTASLGAHMLEVCPTIAAGKPCVEVHPLGIGDREPPARLVFEGKAGKATVASLVEMGGRYRLIVQDIECIKPILPMPNLPVARVMWKPEPALEAGVECWLRAGGAHHTVLSFDVDAEQYADLAKIWGIEYVHIGKDTTLESLEKDLMVNEVYWRLKSLH